MKPRRSYGPLTDDQRDAVAANIGLAYKVARLLENRGLVHDPDEALHIGHRALMRAVQVHGEFGGRWKLSTIVFKQSRSFLSNYRKQAIPRGYRGRVERPSPSIASFDESHMAPDGRDPAAPVDARDILRAIGSAHAALLREYYLDGRRAPEIAASAGLSKQRIHQRIDAALAVARKAAGVA